MLNKNQIERLIKQEKLISGFIDLKKQLTPNGFDLTAGSIAAFASGGKLDFSNQERVLAKETTLKLKKKKKQDKYGWWELKPGTYKVKTNETVSLSRRLTALAFSRTSLLRMGCFTLHGVWDAGFSGKGEFILTVENKKGVEIKENARLAQLVFFPIEETEGYQGIYKGLV